MCVIKVAETVAIAKIVKRFNIQRDKGIIPILENEKIRFNLVDNQQNTKLYNKPYFLSIPNKTLINTTFNKIYSQGKLSWIKRLIPFKLPVFVVQ